MADCCTRLAEERGGEERFGDRVVSLKIEKESPRGREKRKVERLMKGKTSVNLEEEGVCQ
jgi:hypothetical protein